MKSYLKLIFIPLFFIFIFGVLLLGSDIFQKCLGYDKELSYLIINICELISFIFVLIIYKKLFVVNYKKIIGFRTLKLKKAFSFSLISVGFFFFLQSSIVYFLWKINILEEYATASDATYTIKEFIIYRFGTVILAPIYEEMCCRIIPLYVMKGKTNVVISIIITSIIFTILHGRGLSGNIELLIVASLYAIIFLKTENGVYPILAHMINNLANAIIVIINSFYPSSMIIYSNVNGHTVFKPTIIVIGILITAIGLFILFIKPQKDLKLTGVNES
jgi:membrane protease YdiL (CAAX protease family)